MVVRHPSTTPSANPAAHLSYRVPAELQADLLSVSGDATHTMLRNQTFSVAEKTTAQAFARARPGKAEQLARALTLQLDHTYIRAAANEATRHLAVLAGEIGPEGGGPKRRFASLANSSKCPPLVRGHLEQSGYTQQTELFALTDGDEVLRNLARAASDGSIRIILDWLHLAMRLQPLEQIAQGLRVSSCGAESTSNFLINRRMNKSRQMRWSLRGADLILMARAAVLNGEFDVLIRPGSAPRAANADQYELLPLAA